MTEPEHPTQGARLLLERRSVAPDQTAATYRAAVVTADARFDYDAILRMDGTVELAAVGPAAEPLWEERLANHARLTARDAARRRADKLAPWPARLLRWRAG